MTIINMGRKSEIAIIKNIILLREKHNLTKEELSLALDLDNSYIGKLENRQINLTVEILDKIAEFFHIETPELFKAEGAKNSKVTLKNRGKIKNVRKRLGKNISKLRTALQISQEELSLRLGLSLSYIGRLENGDMNVTLDKLISLADFLEVDPYFLLK